VIAGALLFLPVPLVLWLFTWAPLGPLPSLGLGVLVMLSHRLYARPFALGRAARRCLYCGGRAAGALEATDPLGSASWGVCSERHAALTASVLHWTDARAAWLRAGILGTLAVFLVLAAASGLGWRPVTYPDAVALFRLGVAASVLPLGWLATRKAAPPGAPLRSPFPLHVPALVGTQTVLWLFRLVGLVWLAQGLLHAGRRLLGS